MIRKITVIAAVLLISALLGAQNASNPKQYVSVDPIDTVTVKAGKSTPMEFTVHVQPGFHINSSKPTLPELIPTQLGFSPPMDLVIGKVQYPAGQLTSFPFDPTEKLSVYSGDVVIKAVLIAEPKAAIGNYTIHGEFKYQACDNNSCFPPKKVPVQFDVKVAKSDVKKPVRRSPQSPHIHN